MCAQLSRENDPAKIAELADDLRSMVASNMEEARLRLEFVVRHFPKTVPE
jgi:hypothetical protein